MNTNNLSEDGLWRIQSTTERDFDTEFPLYWSNDLGWVLRPSSDTFTTEEKESFNLPLGGRWLPNIL
jgi:hypothetical protein